MFLSDKIKNDWVGRFCNTRGRKRNLVHLLRVAECKRPTGGYRLTLKDRLLGVWHAGLSGFSWPKVGLEECCKYCNESKGV